MHHTTTVVVGAGHCGLAMSRRLAARSIDHVVLERGEVARLVAHPAVGLAAPAHPELDDPAAGLRLPRRRPGRLPHRARGGPAARGLRRASAAPVRSGVTVTSVRPGWPRLPGVDRSGNLDTRPRSWSRPARPRCRLVPAVPVPTGITTVTARGLPQPRPAATRRRAGRGRLGERRPDRRRAAPLGAAGDPRRRRARADAADLPRARHPLVAGRGRRARRALRGAARPGAGAQPAVDAAGRLATAGDGRPHRAAAARRAAGRAVRRRPGRRRRSSPASLPNVCALADLKLGRLLDTLDAWADRAGIDAEAPQRFAPTELPAPADLSARLGEGGIETIVWATGYRPDLSFVDAGVFDRKGRPVHDGGVTAAPGLYLIGLPFLRRRKSTLIDGGGVGRPRAGRAPRRPPGHARPATGELRGTSVELHPVAAQVAADVARRDPQRLVGSADRDRATARPAARRPDRGPRAGERRRAACAAASPTSTPSASSSPQASPSPTSC